MKYLQNGGFQNHTLMKLTLAFTLLFLTAFWISNFAIYFAKMDLTPASVRDYYLGSENDFRMPRTYQSMLEVTHAHLPMMAMVVLLLTHLMIFAPYTFKAKVTFISASFSLGLLNELSGWLVRFVGSHFAILKVIAFVGFQGMLGFLLSGLAIFLLTGKSKRNASKKGLTRHESEKSINGATQPVRNKELVNN